ncbi:Uroporphyrinogen decarboxylase [Clarias magur]|uniref:Uroporphyrinogen decarboxylase n=1 Tax=Clarias magur TaxID=1594786 RepID=A0A8J4WMN5_CLAMG|nr:Uroporphyrinogen decarboxylase [Clarias magur]KAF5879891.1 Uroporphyrinogen decarboxylase [Clarias magur]
MDAEGRAGRGARGRGESAFRRTEAPPGGGLRKKPPAADRSPIDGNSDPQTGVAPGGTRGRNGAWPPPNPTRRSRDRAPVWGGRMAGRIKGAARPVRERSRTD